MSARLLRPTAAESREIWVAASYAGLARLDGFVFISSDGANFIAIGPDSGTFVPETGINDPTVMRWQGRFYMCYGDGPPAWSGVGPRVHIAVSDDMVSWSPLVTLVLGPVGNSPGLDIPTWIIDPQGPAITAINSARNVLCVRPISPSPDTWSDPNNWQEAVALKDASDNTLSQGNTYVVYKDGTYYMAFNDTGWAGYKTRTSQSLTTGWSAPTTVTLGGGEANNGDTQPLVLKADGRFRWYATNGNSHTYELWYYESDDFVTWSAATPLSFIGMGEGFAINWTDVSRLMVPASLASRLFNEYTPTLSAPSEPLSVSASPGDQSVSLSWSLPESNGLSPITDYVVQFSDDDGDAWTTFSDGVSSTRTATVTGLTNGTAYVFRVAAVNAIGTSPYSAASPSVTPAEPPPDSTALLMHFDNDLSDSSANELAATAAGDAAVSGDQAKWGTGSLLLDGDGDYVAVESSSAFAFSTFTVEAWIYAVSWPQYCWLVDFRDGGAFTMGFGSGKFYPYVGNVDSQQTSGATIPSGEWVHVAFCYDGTSVKCYTNGVLSYTLNDPGASQSANGPKIGSNSSGGGEFFNGYIDDLRISDGVRYTANFTPPAGPFSA